MDEHEHAQLLGLGPEWVELRVGQLITGDIAANRNAPQALFPHTFLKLCGGKLWELQCG
jgi:hypothetical protein